MPRTLKLSPTGGPKDGLETLSISRSSKRIRAMIKVFRFVDKDTNQFVAYCPSLEVSGYGDNKEKAITMLRFSIDEYFTYLLKLSASKLEQELRNNGWIHGKLQNKKYSKAYVDMEGQLQNLNAVENTLEELTLTAA